MELNSRFLKFIEKENLIFPDDKVLLAVSGGMDSMAMLHLFINSSITFEVAHCNFNLRGKESDADEDLLRNVCKERNIAFYSKKFATKAFAKKHSLSTQEAARELRYKWFQEICVSHQFDKLATAHHLNDSIETFFINLHRGTGINGLKGIPVKNENIVRPLSDFTKDEIKTFVKQNNIPYRDDASNKDYKYLRNWFRNELLPFWKKRKAELDEVMKGNIQIISRQAELLEKLLKKELAPLQHQLKKGQLSIEKILFLTDPEIMLFELFKSYGYSFSDMEQLYTVLLSGKSGKVFESEKFQIYVDRESIFLQEKSMVQKFDEEYFIGDKNDLKKLPLHFQMKELFKEQFSGIDTSPNVLQVDFEKISFPLILRKWRVGDSFVPIGMRGTKKISDFLIDQKVPMIEKEKIYVLISNQKIVWVVGYRADERFKISNSTKKILEIELKKK